MDKQNDAKQIHQRMQQMNAVEDEKQTIKA